ncbi:hypothetical protein EDC01DRAFT_636327 [Geopyxis carbonaria]|nr:hypothetical protein EDC01DRAFT_636327 [Geopyxis carbonaria]
MKDNYTQGDKFNRANYLHKEDNKSNDTTLRRKKKAKKTTNSGTFIKRESVLKGWGNLGSDQGFFCEHKYTAVLRDLYYYKKLPTLEEILNHEGRQRTILEFSDLMQLTMEDCNVERKRKSDLMFANTFFDFKRPKTQYEPRVTEMATFENGMRLTRGKGKMNRDYIGVVLPLTNEYNPRMAGYPRAPWMKRGKLYNKIKDGLERLSVEIHDFLQYMSRTIEEIKGRDASTNLWTHAIESFFGDHKHQVHLYGSNATGIGLPICDIDLMIVAPGVADSNPYKLREMRISVLYQIQEFLYTTGISNRLAVRDEAQIPLLEARDMQTSLEVDISFEEPHIVVSLEQVQNWKILYGEQDILALVIVIKHALGMRKLGLGSASTPYEGGIGSYVLLCMIVVYLDKNQRETGKKAPYHPTHMATLFLGFCKFWGVEFDYETCGVEINPPAVIPKSRGIPPYIFEIRNPHPSASLSANIAGSYFYEVISTRISQQADSKNSSFGPNDTGILGLIIAGNYDVFEMRRKKIIEAADREDEREEILKKIDEHAKEYGFTDPSKPRSRERTQESQGNNERRTKQNMEELCSPNHVKNSPNHLLDLDKP